MPAQKPEGSGPVGQGNYEVQQGDCIDSVAFRFGFFWETVWNLPENADLKRIRRDPNVLMPCDKLTVPKLRPKELDAATDARHRYVKKGVPAKFVMCFYEDSEPRAWEPYRLIIDGVLHSGELDSNGRLELAIPPDAQRGELIIDDDEPFPIWLGTLDPVATIVGVQGRLRNLGFNPGPIDGIFGPNTEDAVRVFQQARGLPVTGELDDSTRDELVRVHGS